MTLLETVFIVALGAKLAAELVLDALNRGQVAKNAQSMPAALEGIMSEEKFQKANEYTLVKSKFGTIGLLLDAAILAVVILSGALPLAYEAWSGAMGEAAWSSALFLVVVMMVLSLPGLPLEYWEQFNIEERFGFNRSTKGLWIGDKIKGTLVGLVIGFPLLWLLISLVGWLGEYWWIWGFGIMFGFQLVMMVLYPMLIIPLFNKLTPLEDGPLRSRLMAMSDKAGFKCNAIQVIDGSKRSAHSNAYFTGFGKFRRIVLYDTLIEQLGEDEIEAVLAHEIGHYKRGHIPKMIASSAAMMFGGFWIIGYLADNEAFFHGFGFEETNIGIAFLLFGLIGGLFTFWMTPIFNVLSRKHEYEADAFARDVVGDWKPLSRALRSLSEKNLSNLQPHPAYSGFHYSHPTLLEREAAMAGGDRQS
ncbi:M48 family metallopeptidase [Pelagicoccus sp. SDUM812005]|uniref:M48 family metallopeptidase n=1 Tax=Pelagicoccus sp. SDUM812005 TaxID=3041257 RepID=UPI00280E32EB|nr:M48 family metallopeptidase [Pelagicoccus sp. SDUM812005]MDQ8182177.1 M48 family metallopeptidase [Pelagicoccus sp. SDUM812005]